MLLYSEASERNKNPILVVLETELARCTRILEIGSGTGQHAVHFAKHLPHLLWQPSDVEENLGDLSQRVALEGSSNLLHPIRLDVRERPWPVEPVDGIFTANTLHILSMDSVRDFFRGVEDVLAPAGVLCVYGPFSYGGRHTSDSNAAFDRHLRQRDPASGVRNFEAVDERARAAGLEIAADHAMPANNRTLVWRRSAA